MKKIDLMEYRANKQKKDDISFYDENRRSYRRYGVTLPRCPDDTMTIRFGIMPGSKGKNEKSAEDVLRHSRVEEMLTAELERREEELDRLCIQMNCDGKSDALNLALKAAEHAAELFYQPAAYHRAADALNRHMRRHPELYM